VTKVSDINDVLGAHGRAAVRQAHDAASRFKANGDGIIAPQQPTIIRLTFFEDISIESARKSWLIKNVMAKGETSTWIAPPGAGKSALLTSAVIAVVTGRDWFGFKTKGTCAAAYFAFERAALVRRRLLAHRMRDSLDTRLPIAVGDQIVNLMDARCVDLLLPTIKAIEDRYGVAVGLALFDTYNKGIAFGGGDEDKARDQNRALGNLRHLQEPHDSLHIAVIGHTGKDESRGARGSNALPGDADLQNQISSSGDIKVVTTTKGNDQPEGEMLRYGLAPYELGSDEDGEPIKVWIVAGVPAVNEIAAKLADRNLPAHARPGLHALFECLADCGRPGPASEHIPEGVRCVRLDEWRHRLFQLSLLDRGKGYRQKFHRIRVTLINANKIGVWEENVWPSAGVR